MGRKKKVVKYVAKTRLVDRTTGQVIAEPGDVVELDIETAEKLMPLGVIEMKEENDGERE